MNKKITSRVIKIIVSQAIIFALAITAIGATSTVHKEFKSTADNQSTTETQNGGDTGEISNTDVHNENITSGAETTENTTENTSKTDATKSTSANTSKTDTTKSTSVNSDYLYAYAGFNPKTTDVSVGVTRILVNGDYQLPEGYKPTLAEAVKGSGVMLDYRVAPYYQAMYDAAKADGITLTPISGYRTYERQKNNFEARIKQYMNSGMDKKEATIEAAKIIMLPGASEHNAGLAMDICSLSESFENTEEFEWLSKHAPEYGFILRYPKAADKRAITKVTYEPWHYRYVGVDAAQEITRKGITLEEYLGVA